MSAASLAGTGPLTRLGLRRDRIMLPSWLYFFTAVAVGTAYTSRATYSTLAKRLAFGETINKNPGMLALYGPVQDPHSAGSVSVWKVGGIAAVLVGVMSVVVTVRHTRADEESGRLELVSAGVVGRYAALTAALTTALTVDLALLVLVSAGLIALGLPATGSIAFGLGWFAIGLMGMGIAAVTAQLTTTSRTADGLALSVLGGAYLVRAVGDAGAPWLVWVSPLGWVERLRPYAGERWWVLGPVAVFTAACLVAAYVLIGRRDIGSGLLPARLGPAEADAALRGPQSLAWCLHRGVLLGWAVGFVVYGAAIGSVVDSAGDMLGGKSGRDVLAKLGGRGGIEDSFVTATMSVMALLASAYAVQAVLRLRSEETGGLAEPILATRVGRVRWAASHLAFAVLGPVVLLVLDGAVVGLIHGLRAHDLGGRFPRVFWSALVQLPAVWGVAALALALFGLAPRFVVASWGLLAAFLLLGQLGPLLGLRQWMMDLSPFTHVPKLPGAAMRTTPILGLVAVATALIAVGLAALRRRDVG